MVEAAGVIARSSRDGVGDHAMRVAKRAAFVFHALQQPPPPTRPPHDALGRRQALGMLLEALDAKELGADRIFGRLLGYAHAVFLQGLIFCRGQTEGADPGWRSRPFVFGIPMRRNQRKWAITPSRNDLCSA